MSETVFEIGETEKKNEVRAIITAQTTQQLAWLDEQNDGQYQYRAITLPGERFFFEAALAASVPILSDKAQLHIDCYENNYDTYERLTKRHFPPNCSVHYGPFETAGIPAQGFHLVWADYCCAPHNPLLFEHPLTMATRFVGPTLVYYTFCQRTRLGIAGLKNKLGLTDEYVAADLYVRGIESLDDDIGVGDLIESKIYEVADSQGVDIDLVARLRYRGAATQGGVHGPPMVTVGFQVGSGAGLKIKPYGC